MSDDVFWTDHDQAAAGFASLELVRDDLFNIFKVGGYDIASCLEFSACAGPSIERVPCEEDGDYGGLQFEPHQ